uniref:RteC domain-containing protein n=1 Tax=Riemerella columbina TaxID=103810 RepID=UPI000380858B
QFDKIANENHRSIHWTESKAALVELIYALHATKAISGGQISLNKIFEMIMSCNTNFVNPFLFSKKKFKSVQYLDYFLSNIIIFIYISIICFFF